MGLPPDFPIYTPGTICVNCVDALFDGLTPQYLLAKLEGIIACPTFPDPGLNGEHLLTQTGTPCRWTNPSVPQAILFQLNAGSSVFTITGAGSIFFLHTILTPCQTLFTNQANCLVPSTVSTGGTAEIFWGPDIHP